MSTVCEASMTTFKEKNVMLPSQFSHSNSEAPGCFDFTLNAEPGPGLEGNCS